MAEKLEGVRVRWNPELKSFVTMLGKKIAAPGLHLPDEAVEGILQYVEVVLKLT